jgi:hypothetical protein
MQLGGSSLFGGLPLPTGHLKPTAVKPANVDAEFEAVIQRSALKDQIPEQVVDEPEAQGAPPAKRQVN